MSIQFQTSQHDVNTNSLLWLQTNNIADVCLNIGCGDTCPKNWENIDASLGLKISKIPLVGRSILSVISNHQWSTSIKYGDIVKGLRKKQNQYQLIFACHILEHLSFEDFHQAMANIYTYLKPGGTFRAIVPDLEQYVRTYLTHREDPNLAKNASHSFMRTSWLGKSSSRNSFFSRLTEGFSNSRHQWMWDEVSLKAAFVEHGFTKIRRCYYGDYEDTRFGDVEKIGNFVKAIGIEGIK